MRLILLLALLPTLARAGAWTRPPGEVFAQLSYYTIRGAHVFQLKDDLGTREVPEYTENTFQLYAEVGVIDRVTAVASVDVLRHFTVGDDQASGLADTEAGLRLALPTPLPLAVEARFIVPTSRWSEDAAGRLPLGYGELGGDLRLAAGHAFGRHGWVTADAGLRVLTGNPPPTFVGTLSGGYRPIDWVVLELVFRGFRPLSDPEDAVPADQYANRADTRYLGYGAHAGVRLLADVWLGAGIEGGNGHEVANAANVKVSLWRTF